jgi:hypothetical protein
MMWSNIIAIRDFQTSKELRIHGMEKNDYQDENMCMAKNEM